MTRVVSAARYGLEHLEVVDESTPEPTDDQVLIAVRAAAINPMDVKRVDGQFGRDPQALPLRPGVEVSGVVIAIGPDAAPVAVGHEVIGYRVTAGLATEVLTTSDQIYAKPAGLAWDEAAGLLLAGTTAWHLLDAVGADPGTSVVVMAASGAVGSLAVQLARHRGAAVIGVGSPGSLRYIESLGAQASTLDDLETVVAHIGAVAAIDTIGTDATLDAVARIADPGRSATIAGYAHADELGIPALGNAPGADPGLEIRQAARKPLIELAAAGVLRVRIARSFPIEETAAAFALLASGHPHGKVLIAP